jgi:inactivated superfamily I helicase
VWNHRHAARLMTHDEKMLWNHKDVVLCWSTEHAEEEKCALKGLSNMTRIRIQDPKQRWP